jgi:hypothetical protein
MKSVHHCLEVFGPVRAKRRRAVRERCAYGIFRSVARTLHPLIGIDPNRFDNLQLIHDIVQEALMEEL